MLDNITQPLHYKIDFNLVFRDIERLFLQLDWTCRFGNVKAILQLKKSVNLGEIPNNFRIIANKLLELEGTFSDGFDSNIKYILNKKNWNLANCKFGKPPIILKKHCDQYAFNLFCFPVLNDKPHTLINPDDPDSPFLQFNPSDLGPLISIPKFNDFVDMAIRYGDEADIELLKYAHILVEQLIVLLTTSLQVVENSGHSIQQIFLSVDLQFKSTKTDRYNRLN